MLGMNLLEEEWPRNVKTYYIPINEVILHYFCNDNLLKKETSLKKSVKSKQLRAGWDNDYLTKLLNA